ncbi:MAG: hypothetical protein OEM52_06330 [bacterium]|nr:hypothetical protein [bacterium]
MNRHSRLEALFLMVFIGQFLLAPGCKKTTTSKDDGNSNGRSLGYSDIVG